MCGIVGLYAKTRSVSDNLGSHVAAMLIQMGERGPDSAGAAFYADGPGQSKVTIQHEDSTVLDDVITKATATLSGVTVRSRGNHRVIESSQSGDETARWVAEHFPDVRIMSSGERIEIYKEKGHPREFVDAYQLDDISGSHALAHTRMATESAITTSHSHPFSTGLDLCLVHNGSLSNHNRLRTSLQKEGIVFQTDNDSEVAAGYLTWRLMQGDSLKQALIAALRDLDGFYTFAIGTRNGFAVLRDPIACKPAVLAETDDWVAMASEYRAIAQLPGADKARVWEPEPAQIYSWEAGQAA